MPFELQPQTPVDGSFLTDKFQPHQIKTVFENLNLRGKRYGMVFTDRERSYNSHLALLASEYAKDIGCFEEFRANVFRAYFTDCKNIGKLESLLEIATESGMSSEELKRVLNDGRYEERLNTAAQEARRLRVQSIPAFVFEGGEVVLGALSPDKFRDTLKSIENGTYIKQ